MSNFFKNTDIDSSQAEAIVTETLKNCDDGELYLENHKSEAIVLDDNKIKSSSYNSDQGYGFRAVTGEVVAYSHSNDISKDSLIKSSDNYVLHLKGGTFNRWGSKDTDNRHKEEQSAYESYFKNWLEG